MTFEDGGTSIGTGTLNVVGGYDVATLTAPSTVIDGISTHTITAVYASDTNNFSGSTTSANFLQAVAQATTATTVTSAAANPVLSGTAVTFTATVTAATTATLQGTVTFLDNGTSLGTGSINGPSGNQTTLPSVVLQPAGEAHTITAVYNSDDSTNFIGSTSGVYTQTVQQITSTSVVTSAPEPSAYRESVTFTATVTVTGSTAGHVPSGTVTFLDGSTSIGTCTLNGGTPDTATYSTSALTVGSTHSITAVYGGDALSTTSVSATAYLQNVTRAGTTVTVSNAADPAGYAQNITLTATVTPDYAGTATGTVTFADGGTSIGTATLSGGVASLPVSLTPQGTHTITASYPGDGNFTGNDNTGSPFMQTIGMASTTTTVISSANPAVEETSVTFTATVAATPAGSGAPTGTVTFEDNSVVMPGGAVTFSGGTATFSTSFSNPAATHSITAVYSGDSNYNPNTSSPLTQTVLYVTTTNVSSSLNASVYSQVVSFIATVTSTAGPADGTVTFKEGSATLAALVLSSGSATYTTSTLSAASHTITVVYGGDPSALLAPGTGSLTQTVNQVVLSTTVTSSASPVVTNRSVSFTANVSVSGAGVMPATGSVTFMDGAATLVIRPLSGSTATYSTSSLTAGSHTITAVYAGDANYVTSTQTPVVQIVDANTLTWTGTAGTAWSNASNWVALPDNLNVLPINGDSLIFPANAGNPTNNNDLSGLTINSITIRGRRVHAGWQCVQVSAAASATRVAIAPISIPLTLTAPESFSATGGNVLTVSGNVTEGGKMLTGTGAGTISISGVVSGECRADDGRQRHADPRQCHE